MGAVWKKLGALLVALCILPGCGGARGALQRGMDLRGRLLKAERCDFDARITADYGRELYTFVLSCQADSRGDVTFTVTAPEVLSGITGGISGTGGALTFDGTALAFPLLADGQFSPVSAPWVLLATLRGGCLTSAAVEEGAVLLSIDDRYDEDALHLDIRLDGQDLPCRGEIVFGGRRIVTVEVENFTIS